MLPTPLQAIVSCDALYTHIQKQVKVRIRRTTITWNRSKEESNVENASPQAIVDTIQYSGTKRFSSVMPFKLIRRPQLLKEGHLIIANHTVFQSHLLSITIHNNSSIVHIAIISVIRSLITLNSS